MIKLKNKRIINLLSFCLLALVIFANIFFSIKNFGVIEQFDIIQKKLPLFTNSFVIVFLTSIQVIVGITVVIIETLFVTFITNFIANKKLNFSNFLSVIIFSNISSILLNMTVIWIVGLNNLQDLEWLGWSPGSQMLLSGFVYLYLSNLNDSISNRLKVKISVIIFSITYGLTFIIQMLMTFV